MMLAPARMQSQGARRGGKEGKFPGEEQGSPSQQWHTRAGSIHQEGHLCTDPSSLGHTAASIVCGD